jgi:lysophospholipase
VNDLYRGFIRADESRSALYSAGALTELDIRNSTAKDMGTGGLLQVASYHTGLSGGSWIGHQ